MADLNKILEKYGMSATLEEYGEGHINDTYIFEYDDNKYILQRINHNIFKRPQDVMSNILKITEHINHKLMVNRKSTDRKTLKVILTKDNQPYCEVDGNFYRMYEFIKNTITYQSAEKPKLFYYAAKGFGEFFNLLSDFPVNHLKETIPDFHNTPKRYNDLIFSFHENRAGRAETVANEMEFVTSRRKKLNIIEKNIEAKTVPMRVTHNDTKLNNILFDEKTKKALCVIDLDTVMPGSILYDYGDALRFGASTAAEDEKDLDKVQFDLVKYEQFTKGFIEQVGKILTLAEKCLLPISIQIITMEIGIRFLTDYLDGDTYFKTSYENHNLDRARTQFKLVLDMEEKISEMYEILNKIFEENGLEKIDVPKINKTEE